MFSRKSRAERTAAEAWDYLSSAMTSAGESAKDAGKHTAGAAGAKVVELAGKATKQSHKLARKASRKTTVTGAGARVNAVTDEAWTRATLAANALAGRKPGLPWGIIVGASLIGVALGWAAASTARAAVERQAENEELQLAETAVVATPTYDR
jgi:hypothetical protein